MSKQKVSAKAVLADIRSGIGDAELMEKYHLSPRGLQSLYEKLIERGIITADEISSIRKGLPKPVETKQRDTQPRSPTVRAQSQIDPKVAEAAADLVRKGSHDNELMMRFGLSPSQLEHFLESLVQLGYVSIEELEARKPRKAKPAHGYAGGVADDDDLRRYDEQDPNRPMSSLQPELEEPDGMATPSKGLSYDRYCAWEDRQSQGTMRSYFQTASRCLLSPVDFFSKLPLDNGYWSPVLFSVMSVVVAVILTSLWFQVLKGGVGMLGLIGLMFVIAYTFILSLIFVPIGLFLWSLLIHGTLMLLKGSQSGFQATFRVVAYSSLTTLFSAIPVLGHLASLWGLYLSVVGLRETHETTTGKAAGAVLIPLSVAVLLGLCLGLMSSSSSMKAGSSPHVKASIAKKYTGKPLPSEVCSSIKDFVEKVDGAVALGTVKAAQLEMRDALQELEGTLKRFASHPNINEVRQNTAAFAMTRLSIMAFREKFGQRSGIDEAEQRVEEFRATLESMCAN